MKYVKRQYLPDAEHGVVFSIQWSAELLVTALSRAKDLGEGSLAQALLDEGGPWMQQALQDFRDLNAKDKNFVLDHVIPMAVAAAEYLQRLVEDNEWTFLWSEVQTVGSWSPKGLPKVSQPDMIGGNVDRLDAIDWKTTHGYYLKGDAETKLREKLHRELRRIHREPLNGNRLKRKSSARIITIRCRCRDDSPGNPTLIVRSKAASAGKLEG